MSDAAFIDANVVIYASGAEHPLKRPCAQIIQAIALDRSQCWSSAEVLQELLYVPSRRLHWQRTREAVTGVAMLLSDHIVPVDRHHILWCLEEEPVPALQARDRVHLAVMHRLGITRIAFDRQRV